MGILERISARAKEDLEGSGSWARVGLGGIIMEKWRKGENYPIITESEVKERFPEATRREIRRAMREHVRRNPGGWILFEAKEGGKGVKKGEYIMWQPTPEERKRGLWPKPPWWEEEEEEGVSSREEGLFAAFPFLGGERMVGIFKGKERLRSAFEKSRSLKVGTRIMPAGGFLRLPPVEEESYAMFPFLGGKMRGKNPLREALQRKQSKIMEILRKH